MNCQQGEASCFVQVFDRICVTWGAEHGADGELTTQRGERETGRQREPGSDITCWPGGIQYTQASHRERERERQLAAYRNSGMGFLGRLSYVHDVLQGGGDLSCIMIMT